MKLVRYGKAGAEKPGLLDRAGRIRDLSAQIPDVAAPALAPAEMARLAALDPESLPPVGGKPRLGPCVGNVGNFIAVGLNYADHAKEAGDPIPAEPILFNKARSYISGPDDDIVIPRGSVKTDWEVELAIVIGRERAMPMRPRPARHRRLLHLQRRVGARIPDRARRHLVQGQGLRHFRPPRPLAGDADEIADVQKLAIWLEVNGERVQNGTTANMIFPARFIVSYISQFMILEPGDVITTGTPAGRRRGLQPRALSEARRQAAPGDRRAGRAAPELRAHAAGA